MKKHKIIITALALTVVASLTACGNAKDNKKETSTVEPTKIVDPVEETAPSVVSEDAGLEDFNKIAEEVINEIEKDDKLKEVKETIIVTESVSRTIVQVEVEDGTKEDRVGEIAKDIKEKYKKALEKSDVKDVQAYSLQMTIKTIGKGEEVFNNIFNETISK